MGFICNGISSQSMKIRVSLSWVTRPGDIWHLEKHRLMYGDVTKTEDVAILMNGKKANLVDGSIEVIATNNIAFVIKNTCSVYDERGLLFI